VAILLKAHRDLVAERVREIVVMGGALGAGNVAPLAEFNILTDPEAAAIVVQSGVPVTLCPLDVTHQALATPAIFERLRALDTPLAQNVAVLLAFFADRYRDVWGMPEPPLHDPVTVAHLIDPTLLQIVDAHVAIELHGTHTRGATACDRFGVTGQAPNARVAIGIDADRFWDLVLDAVDRLGR
jgi:purine nucleosidase/pyrimidine-specific ribonucleoside hydrolase